MGGTWQAGCILRVGGARGVQCRCTFEKTCVTLGAVVIRKIVSCFFLSGVVLA